MEDAIEREDPGFVYTWADYLGGNGEIRFSLTGDGRGVRTRRGPRRCFIPSPSPFRGLAFSISVRTDRVDCAFSPLELLFRRANHCQIHGVRPVFPSPVPAYS